MRKAIWGIIVLGLLFGGCQKKTEKIYIDNDDSTFVDVTPPTVAILAPSDGATIILEEWRYSNSQELWEYDLVLKFLVLEQEGLIKSIYVLADGSRREYRDVNVKEFKGRLIHHIKQRDASNEGIERTFSVSAYDSAGNKGKDSITITTIAVR